MLICNNGGWSWLQQSTICTHFLMPVLQREWYHLVTHHTLNSGRFGCVYFFTDRQLQKQEENQGPDYVYRIRMKGLSSKPKYIMYSTESYLGFCLEHLYFCIYLNYYIIKLVSGVLRKNPT
jgi:hypothetical protein